MTPIRALILFLSFSCGLCGQAPELSTYLPAADSYAASIPKPAAVLGFEVGAWHPRPDQLQAYAERLAAASDRVQVQIYGRSHELRPLVLLTISSPENLARLDEIKSARRQLFDPEQRVPDLSDMPLVAYMGYSVHGNESSGASAALLLAYHLAASTDPAVLKQLDQTVIFLDPCLNPDGLARFAHWVNTNRGQRINDDPRHREHHEPWPGGRTNHYWFDLNRDWLLARQPESRARLALVEAWRPNLLTDFHEMGTNSTYFFQPGVRARMNPLIPERNFDLTAKIAEANAAALDRLGALYYSQETFDDFYFGKGSTYPDALGGIGILFEQASSRGHAQKHRYGRIDFPFTIKNQLSCSLASLAAAFEHRTELLSYQRNFYESALTAAVADAATCHVFHAPGAQYRAEALVELLLMHGIRVHRFGANAGGGELLEQFKPGEAFVVPTQQPQFRLVKTLFERRSEFADPVFYDVSAWNVVASFGLESVAFDAALDDLGILGEVVTKIDARTGQLDTTRDEERPYAYVMAWDADRSARALIKLQDAEIRVLAASEPLQVQVESGPKTFGRGSLVIPIGIQDREPETLNQVMSELVRELGIDIHVVTSGLTAEGVDLGSPSLVILERPRVLLLVGEGCSVYEAGHVWHQLDQVLGMQVTLLDQDQLSATVLNDYSHLIAVSGAERVLGRLKDDLGQWLRRGGTLISQQRAAFWVGSEVLGLKAVARAPDDQPKAAETYGERAKYRAENRISGAIFRAQVDLSHPLCWGLVQDQVHIWHSGVQVLPEPKNKLDAVVRFRGVEDILFSGYAAARMRQRLADSCAATAERHGRGLVVRFADNMNFRAIWPGTSRMFTNAIFMAPTTESTDAEDEADEALDDESH